MLRYLLRQLCYGLLLLWGVATVVFFLFNTLPGQKASPASLEVIRKTKQPDNPLWTRYGQYMNALSPIGITSSRATSDAPQGIRIIRLADSNFLALKTPYLGRTFRTKQVVSNVLWEALPGTLLLALTAMLIAALPGILLGVLAALKKGTAWDTGVIATSVAGISTPSFFAGLVIAYISGHLLSDYTGLRITDSNVLGGRSVTQFNLLLPAIALSIRPMAVIIQLVRSSLLDVLRQDYIHAAYAKGQTKTGIVLRHALRNALKPLLAATSGWLAELLAGLFFIEYIFGRKGIGKTAIDALGGPDLPVVMGATLLMALIFITGKLLTNVLHAATVPLITVKSEIGSVADVDF